MSTRGTVSLVKGKKILKTVYISSDGYLSNVGIELIELFKKNKIIKRFKCIEYMDENVTPTGEEEYTALWNGVFNENCEKKFPSLIYTIDELIHTAKSTTNYWYDYTYLYDINKNHINIYHFGKYLLTITKENVEVVEKFIEVNELYNQMCFDKKTFSINKDWSIETKKLFKTNPTVEDIEKIYNKKTPKVILGNCKYSDCCDNKSYKRTLLTYDETQDDYKRKTFFIISNLNKDSWSLYLQLPFIRIPIKAVNSLDNYKTSAAVDKDLVTFVRENQIKIYNFCVAIGLYVILREKIERANIEDVDKIYNEKIKEIDNYLKTHETIVKGDFNINVIIKNLNKIVASKKEVAI